MFDQLGGDVMRWLAWMACAGGLAILAGCSQAPARVNGGADLDSLYGVLDEASAQYAQALQQARRGDRAQSRETLESALDTMRNASDRCVNTEGCDTQRFLSAYDRALRLKDGSFLGTDDATATLDVEDQDQDAGDTDSGVLATLPEARRTVAMLHGHTLADLVANNGTIQAALQVWLTRLRPNLIRAYVDYQYLRYQMWPAFHHEGLPEAVLFGMLAKESGGRVHAVSRSGAAGPLQFMPATGARFGLNTVDGFDQRFDPTMASRASADYLNEQLARLNGDLALTLAAYNGGEGRVGRLSAGAPGAGFWSPDIYFSLSAETREYVPMVLAAAWLFLHPDDYNLHFPDLDGAPGHVDLARAASLDQLSVCLGDDDAARYGWYRTLRNLNPQMDPDDMQPEGTRVNLPKFLQETYRKSCVTGKWVALADHLQDAKQPPALRVAYYTVRSGDTLSAISRRFDCRGVRDLARSNDLRSASRLRIGQRLRLAGCRKR